MIANDEPSFSVWQSNFIYVLCEIGIIKDTD